METKIYTHTDHRLYCPKCLRELWDGEHIYCTDRIRCLHCDVDVFIDYKHGVTRISEGISFHNNTVTQKREGVLNVEKTSQ